MFRESIVKQGMLHSCGELLLMLDADGATKVDDLEKLESQVGVVILLSDLNFLVENAGVKNRFARVLDVCLSTHWN